MYLEVYNYTYMVVHSSILGWSIISYGLHVKIILFQILIIIFPKLCNIFILGCLIIVVANSDASWIYLSRNSIQYPQIYFIAIICLEPENTVIFKVWNWLSGELEPFFLYNLRAKHFLCFSFSLCLSNVQDLTLYKKRIFDFFWDYFYKKDSSNNITKISWSAHHSREKT